MRYLALVVNYDETLASNGKMSQDCLQALQRVRISGRRVILVTGRRLDDLFEVCEQPRAFDLIVAENGAVVYSPRSREQVTLGPRPSDRLVQSLRHRNVEPLDIGEVIIATHAAHRGVLHDVVWKHGLEAQLIGNRSSVMLLPAGINKASGLEYGLRKLGLSRHEVVGIGDAENDHSFLERCECAVAVGNAVPSIKEIATLVTSGENGSGVVELSDKLIADDLRELEGTIERHLIMLGKRTDGIAVRLAPYGRNVLIAGPSGSGKSTLTAGIIERLIEKDYQVCIVDPEGDYTVLRDVVAVGNPSRAPSVQEVLSILEDPTINISVNSLGIPLGDRPDFFAQLIPNLQAMRARTGRPHWLVLDEAHHMLPETWGHAGSSLPQRLGETMLVTVHPDHLVPTVLAPIDLVLAVGSEPEQTLKTFGQATNRELEWPSGLSHQRGQVVAWFVRDRQPPFAIRPELGSAERIRHHRKYAEGDLRWHSFYFRGPGGRHNLKAQNLTIFCQIAEGIDEDTWTYHLRRGDFSRWFQFAVRDDFLADEARRIEQRADIAPWQARKMITELVDSRYTLAE